MMIVSKNSKLEPYHTKVFVYNFTLGNNIIVKNVGVRATRLHAPAVAGFRIKKMNYEF